MAKQGILRDLCTTTTRFLNGFRASNDRRTRARPRADEPRSPRWRGFVPWDASHRGVGAVFWLFNNTTESLVCASERQHARDESVKSL